MRHVKMRCNKKYPDYAPASIQKMRDIAARFLKEQPIVDHILLKQKNEVKNIQ